MAEVARESEKVWTSKVRIAFFLSAMRHFRDALLARGWQVHYRELGVPGEETLGGQLRSAVASLRPIGVIVTEPGEWSVAEEIKEAVASAGLPLETRIDHHFLCTLEQFAAHAKGRKQLRMEFFYREMRNRTGSLMEDGAPAGGRWNFDAENRESFGRSGPPLRLPPRRFPPDAVTSEVIALVKERFAAHPGSLDDFDWPVTAEEAREALEDFLTHRLPEFGR